jgi:NitT/TauT family transport system substrate-binding protein
MSKIDKLTTGITSGTSQNWTNFIAQDKGFFQDEGLDHNYVSMKDMREGMEQLTRGRVPIVTAMADTPILEIEKGANIRIIASVVRAGFGHIVSSPECKTFDQLRGKSVAVIDPLSGSTVILREILREKGLNYSDYTVKHVGGTPKRYESLQKGEAAAAFLSPPYDFHAEAAGYNLLADYAEHFPSYPLTINVNMDFAKANPEIVMKYLRAMVRASKWIYEEKNREEAIAVLEKNIEVSHNYADKTYEYVIRKIRGISPDCKISLAELENLLSVLVRAGLLKEESAARAAKFLDFTFLELIRK